MVYGVLALVCCGKKIPVDVMRSNAGFYLGTSDNMEPLSRESAEYWRTRREAEEALRDGNWTQLTYC
ncbi:hypothetical protein J1782_08180 [Rahnella sp. BCC 1045]|uniref:hypothetical protein n=1 Tax=Rahnella sp. BCC 1045 TaxID=2816251 RepID=UPI001C26C8AA|nr:hypothetical protein [Rahnella sp. BCC 1045]MBU9819862.1 hypothetical protein [Rahnella sp. BCC 1045]